MLTINKRIFVNHIFTYFEHHRKPQTFFSFNHFASLYEVYGVPTKQEEKEG